MLRYYPCIAVILVEKEIADLLCSVGSCAVTAKV